MQRRSLLKTIAAVPVAPALARADGSRAWLGRDYWANPLQDWQRSNDRIECIHAGGDRNVFWLTKEIVPGPFRMSVRLGRVSKESGSGWAGFRAGMRGHFGDYRDTAIRGLGVEAGITNEGRLFIGSTAGSEALPSLDEVTLKLESDGAKWRLSAGSQTVEANIPREWHSGGVALVCHSGELPSRLPAMSEPWAANAGKPAQTRGGSMRFWFADWTLEGSGVATRPERAWGPILFTQYTVSNGVLKMTVQLAPVEESGPIELRLKGLSPLKSKVEPVSSTAHFRAESWKASSDVPFEVVYEGHSYTGTIRRDPANKNEIMAASLTCQGDFGFPHSEIAKCISAAKPDILFFTGDQLYEANGGYAIQRAPANDARLDYLRKWYMFGWAWGELTRHTPCVCLADDHDVYHGNIWGAAGRKSEFAPVDRDADQPAQQIGQDSGGYLMPAAWVNVVYRTQSSHLPDSPDPSPIDQGITTHYGPLNWGGIGFALLEDRKWKSAPRVLMPEAKIRNGWPQNPKWNAATQGDVEGAQLLGERQERFLQQWAQDWPEGIEMKAVVSATIFCNLCTLPPGQTSDAGTPKIPIQPPDGYAPDEHFAADHDSNGWPQTPRNRALRSIRSCLAVHLAGDQHLASTLQYGIDDFEDGPFAICSPAISNIFPRRWFPPQPGENRKEGSPKYTGRFRDGFGNHITVHAVANPQTTKLSPTALYERTPGYGLVYFNKRDRTIRLENYSRQPDGSAKMYPGWPITIRQMDNGLNGAKYELRLPKKANGLIVVTKQGESTPYLTWRTRTPLDRIPVWAPGSYEIKGIGVVQASEKSVETLAR